MRNIINRGATTTPEDDNADPNHTPQHEPGARIAGGAPGIPEDSDSSVMGGGNMRQFGSGPKAKRYRVVSGGWFMMNNYRVALRAGKEIEDHQYDIPKLKKQGIRLEEVVDETAPPVPPIPVEVQPRRPASISVGGELGTPEANVAPAPAGDPAAAPPAMRVQDTDEQAETRRKQDQEEVQRGRRGRG